MDALLSRWLGPGGGKKDALVLILGTLSAQLLAVVASPWLTRLYSPEQFGLLGLFIAVAGVFNPILCLRYDAAIVLADDDKAAAAQGGLCLAIVLGMSAIATVIVLAGRDPAAEWLGAPALASWLIALPPALALLGANQILLMWLSRRKAFSGISVARIGQAAVMTGIQILAAAAFSYGPAGLFAGYLAGVGVQGLLLGRAAWSSGRGLWREAFRRDAWRAQAARYRDFPLFAAPGAVAAALAGDGMTLLLGLLFAPETVGWFYLTHRILALPTSLVSHSLAPVVYQRLADARRKGAETAPFIARLFAALFLTAAIPMALLAAFAPWLFGTVFGAEWREAGWFARVMMPNYVLMFCAIPLTQAFYAFEKQKQGAFWQAGSFAFRALGLWIGAGLGGPRTALFLYGTGGAILYGMVAVLALRWAGTPWGRMTGIFADGVRWARQEFSSLVSQRGLRVH